MPPYRRSLAREEVPTVTSHLTKVPSTGAADLPSDGHSRLEVAYLLKRYPRLSETFILHEMLTLEAHGVRLLVYSMMDPGEPTVPLDVTGWRRQMRPDLRYGLLGNPCRRESLPQTYHPHHPHRRILVAASAPSAARNGPRECVAQTRLGGKQ